jgi:aspartate ammonia-lyase
LKSKEFFGEETRKAAGNFGMGRLPPELIKAYADVKKAVILSIQEFEQRFQNDIFSCVCEAIDRVRDGSCDEQFVLPLRQGGAGTSINMNMNEVIAGLSEHLYFEKYQKKINIDPIEDINRHQSTNDTFPTAVTIVVLQKLMEMEKLIISLQQVLIQKESEYSAVLISGRTEMQSALPITLGQVFASWAGGIERDRWRINKLKERVRTIALGGTAIGTCFFAPKEVVYLAEKHLRQITGLPLSRSQNLTDEIANHDKLAEAAYGLKLFAENLFKMTGDLLLYSSAFIGEIIHPNLQAGSTIMAAKTNPVILEYARGLALDAGYEADKIGAYSRNGQLQLNAFLPFIAESFIRAFDSLQKAVTALNEKFFSRMEIDEQRIEENLASSLVLLNTLVPVLGYNKVKEIYLMVEKDKPKTVNELKSIILDHSEMTQKQLDNYFDPGRLTAFNKNGDENGSC